MHRVIVPIIGRTISSLGSWILFVAAAQTVYAASESAILVGFLAVARLIPSVLIGPAVAPRIQRANRWVLMACLDVVAAICMLVLSTTPSALFLFAASVILAATDAIYSIAYRSAIPTMVSEAKLIQVNAIRTALGGCSVALGPALAGTVLRHVGPHYALAFTAVTFLASGAAMVYTALTSRARPGVTTGVQVSSSGQSSVRASITAALSQPLLRKYFVASAVAGLGYGVLHHLVVYANDVLLGGELAFGALLSALGAGGLLSLTLLFLPVNSIRPFLGYGVALLLDAGVFFFLGSLRLSSTAAVALFFLSGGNDALASMSSETIIQRHAKADSSAQAFALDAAFARIATPLGILALGVVADFFGMRIAFLVSAGLLGAAGIYAAMIPDTSKPR